MKMFRQNYFAIICMAMLFTLVAGEGCSKKKVLVSKGISFSSQEDLARYVSLSINEGNSDAIIEAYIPKKEYIEKIYPKTPEGKSRRHLSGEDFWRIFIERQRISDAMYQAREYKGRIQSISGVGVPKKVIQAGPYRFLHRIPVYMEVSSQNGMVEHVIDDNILGVVIQEGNGYRLFNVFK